MPQRQADSSKGRRSSSCFSTWARISSQLKFFSKKSSSSSSVNSSFPTMSRAMSTIWSRRLAMMSVRQEIPSGFPKREDTAKRSAIPPTEAAKAIWKSPPPSKPVSLNGAASRQINTVPAKSPSAFFFLSMVFLPVFLHYIPPSMEIKIGTLLHVPDDNNYLPASSKARCAASKNCL